MRVLLTVALGASMAMGLAAPSWSQVYRVGTETEEIILDQGNDEDIDAFPEDVVKRQSQEFSTYTTTLFTERFASTDPMLPPDLPSPFNASVRGQAGYYRVTMTEPVLDLEVLR
jgi:hypothetical protein